MFNSVSKNFVKDTVTSQPAIFFNIQQLKTRHRDNDVASSIANT